MTDYIPGIMAINWIPTIGNSKTVTDPASIVAKEIYARVRSKFSGSLEADPPDFVMYIMALDSIYSYIAYLKRIYRILNAYSANNHYLPDGLLTAMGMSESFIESLKLNRMQFWQIINQLVFMTRKFSCPAEFDIIHRHYWLNDNVYMDAMSPNSQFYIFVPQQFYQFTMFTDAGGIKSGGCKMVPITFATTQSINAAEWLFSYGRDLINALANSDDAYTISGYLMRAYEGSPVFTVDELPQDQPLVPIYEPEVLMQIENAQPVMFGGDSSSIGNNIVQQPSSNAVVCNPMWYGELPQWYSSLGITKLENLLSIRSDAPTVADVTIATRLKMGSDLPTVLSAEDKTYQHNIYCASEIVLSVNLINLIDAPNASGVMTRSWYLAQMVGLNYEPHAVDISLLSSFDWHPILRGVGVMNAYVLGDLHNSTLLANEQLDQLNRVCMYSEFNAYGQI